MSNTVTHTTFSGVASSEDQTEMRWSGLKRSLVLATVSKQIFGFSVLPFIVFYRLILANNVQKHISCSCCSASARYVRRQLFSVSHDSV